MKKIAVVPNLFKDIDLSCTCKVMKYLLTKYCTIYIPIEYSNPLSVYADNTKVRFADEDEIYHTAQMIVSIGGDGTILKISHKAAPAHLPILGINMGTVGFMTELEVSEIDLMDSVFNSEYSVEERMMLDVEVIREGTVISNFSALNDAVLSKGVISKLIEIDLYSGDTEVTYYRTDGLIVATPTGSTAYSLSAGGPIVDSELECICVTPVSPHSFMNSRPMVYSPKTTLTLKTSRQRDDQVFLTVDGLENVRILYGDEIRIKKSSLTCKLIRIKNTGFYDVVYKKLSERR
ncbi:MAG: NAD(+)/NADH kinase [Ruminococcaceae bacterium]|nr:NAD(+)/NADH kinase [Oscillospiraceae bacterium]